VIREANIDDIDDIVELHYNNMDKNDLSIILGKRFICEFYKTMIKDESVLVKVILAKDGDKIVSVSSAFTSYSKFQKSLKRVLLKPLMILILNKLFTMRFMDIYHLFKSIISKNYVDILKDDADYHLGLIVVDKNFIRDIDTLKQFRKMFDDNGSYLASMSPDGRYWGSTRVNNITAKNLLEKNIYLVDKHTMSSYPEDIIIYIFKRER